MAPDKIIDWAFDELRLQLETRQTAIQPLNDDLADERRRLLRRQPRFRPSGDTMRCSRSR
jgi:hypothetical protein